MTKESTIQGNVVRLIIAYGGHAIVTRPPGVPAGTPDVLGVYRGRSIGIETKQRGGLEAKPIQKAQGRRWQLAGGRWIVTHTTEDVVMMLDQIDAEIDGTGLPVCPLCNGDEGFTMSRGNPDEYWEACTHCGGSGRYS